MRIYRSMLLCAMITLLLISSLKAGVYMNGTTKNRGKMSKMEMFVEKDRLRFQSTGDMGEQVFIYRGDMDKFWMANNGTVMEMTREDMKQMSAQMDNAMKMMDEKMQGLTDEQKNLMKQYMKDKMPGQDVGQTDKPKTVWKKVGEEKVNNWECQKFQSNDGKTAWTVEPEKLGLTKDDFQVFDSVQEFFSEMTKDNDSFLKYSSTDDSDGLSGFPVKSISEDGDEHLINEITKKTLDPKLFELDKRWKMQEKPMMKPMN